MKYFFIVLICLSGLTGFSQEKKRPVAVLELVSSGKLDKSEVITLTKRFRDMLVQTEVFNVLERDKMDNILKEQDFILSDNCNSAECAVEVGQLLGVEAVVTGDIGKVGDTWTVSLRLVDMTTGKIEKTETMDYQGKIDGMLDVMRQIAFIFAGKKPPKGKATLIVESVKLTPGRWLIEPSIYYSPDGKFTFDNKAWNKNKKIHNGSGLFVSISYMVTEKFKTGISGRIYHYSHRDTLNPVYPEPFDIGTVEIYTIGPCIGYYIFNGAFRPFIDISAGYYFFEPIFENNLGFSQKECEKRKNLSKQSGIYGDVRIGIDIRLSRVIDFRIAPYVLYAKTKPMNGSAALSVGVVYHSGEGFPADDK
jgi:TolB-like protein